jgi:O-antigen/teichoic acid export membrane protein
MWKIKSLVVICLVKINLMREMLALLKVQSKRPIVRNVAAVATGTAFAQVITFIFTPFITRLYGPEALGLQGVFVSVLGLAVTFAAFSYPTAIVLPKSDNDALALIYLSVIIGVGMSILTALVLFFWGSQLLLLFNAKEMSGVMFLVPFAMFFAVLNGVIGQWLIRKKAFKLTARYAIINSLLLGSAKTALGYIHPTAMVLIVTNTIGGLVTAVLTYFGWRHKQKTSSLTSADTSTTSLWQLAKEYRDFPLWRTPQNLINATSQSLPILLLASFFGPDSAGQYTIALAVLGVPSALIGNAVMSVFYPRITEVVLQGGNSRTLIIRATLGMAVAGTLPFVVIIIAGPFLFSFVFGSEWDMAGRYAQLLAPWLFLQYINKPAVSAIPALGLQKGLLIYELFSTATKVIALWAGFAILGSSLSALGLFSFVGVLAYLWLIIWVIQRSDQIYKSNQKEFNETS